MVQTAFQPNAFQNNAFQIAGVGSGRGISSHDRPKRIIRERITQEEANKLLGIYEEVVESLPAEQTKEIAQVVSPFVVEMTQEEWDQRLNGHFAVDIAPAPQSIDFTRLYESVIARVRFMQAVERIKILMLQQQEDEFLLLTLIMAGV